MSTMATEHTTYGVAVGLVKNKKIYLSRRLDTPLFPKKWQFVNGWLWGCEQSQDAAVRVVETQTGIKIGKDRLFYMNVLTVKESNEFYYVYLVHLKDSEVPANTDGRYRSEWKPFELKAAAILDLVPGLRNIIRKTWICMLRVEAEKKEKTEDYSTAVSY